MRRFSLLLLLPVMVVPAGPVGDYLGFVPGRTETALRTGQDSIHLYIPVPWDTVIPRNWTDSTTVLCETLYQGLPAYLCRHVSGETGQPRAEVDTFYETGDTMHARVSLADVGVWPNRYVIPLVVGAGWPLGAAGTYYADLNGDSLEDTLRIWGDSARIIRREDVTVPYGNVPDCYRILRWARAEKRMRQEGIPTRESCALRHHEWYKDSLWWVKDSAVVTGVVWQLRSLWQKSGDYVRAGTRRLEGLTAIAARPGLACPALLVRPSPFRRLVTIESAEPFSVHDLSGRRIRSIPAGRAVWRGDDESGKPVPAGIYFLRTRSARPVLLTRLR
ncbi:hypothetical protein FJY71_05775 [candidate division WOR-3 bacterium]|nr:hypothetical protein [candidate division WOR-3 bacterium]